MTTAGSNFISGITTTVFNSTDVVNKTYVDANVQPLSSQTGNAGEFLITTDGTSLSWDYVSNYQEFTTTGSQTFTVPSYANLLYIEATGAGAGGSAGQTNTQVNQGVTWNLRTIATSGINGGLINGGNGLTFGNNIYVAAGGGLSTSTDAITWILRTAGFSSASIVIFKNNTYVAGGASGVLNTSTDAITWTLRTSSNFGQSIFSITYGNNTYIIGCGTGVLSTSTDTITWTLRTSGFGNNAINALTFQNNTYVAGSLGGILNTSTDAINWTLRTSGVTNASIISLDSTSNLYVALSTLGINSLISSSTDAINWTLRTLGWSSRTASGATRGYVLVFANNFFIAGGMNGLLSLSTDAITWTFRSSAVSILSDIRALTYGNNVYVAGGGDALSLSYTQASGIGGPSGSYTSWYVPKSIVTSNITVNPGVGGAGATTDAGTGSAGAGTTVSWTGPGGTYTITASGGNVRGFVGAAQTFTQSSFYYTTEGLSGAPQSDRIGSTAPTQINQFQPTGGGSGAGSASFAGGSGGSIIVYGNTIAGGSGGTSSGTNGSAGIAYTGLPYGSGGGGGGASVSIAATGGNGARGGGGGGGAFNGSTFGNGGNGGDGYVKITWW